MRIAKLYSLFGVFSCRELVIFNFKMNFKWIVLVCLVAFVVVAESKKYDKKSKDQNQVENKRTKEYVGKKEANSESSPNKEVNAESGQTKEKYNKKLKEYQTKSKEYVKDEKKQNKKVKREVPQEKQPAEAPKVDEPVLSENTEPEALNEAPVEIVEPVVEPKKSKNEASKKVKSSKLEKVKPKPEKVVSEVDCSTKVEAEVEHVQSKTCWNKNQNEAEEVQVAEESA